ncbi:class I SAM-dependent methyltransferase [Streptomyces hebeiensis]|uniref:Class I SAM-dependent methyltransferase n=1 Tax=Streptomyces hebeiensis TaxID=229486 RepID=A0ABP4FSS6_9ACTN
MTDPSYLRTTRAGYDAIAVEYAETFGRALETDTWGRAMLGAFAELVIADGSGPVADLGCGPGRLTPHLNELGLDVFGVDLSPAMIEVARSAHPHLRFEVGSMSALDIGDGALGGIVAWYSIVHTPPEDVHELFDEFHRVLAPGGRLLLAFQVGDGIFHLPTAFDKRTDLDYHRWTPDRLAELLEKAGFEIGARLERARESGERTPQAYLLAHKPATPPDDAEGASSS